MNLYGLVCHTRCHIRSLQDCRGTEFVNVTTTAAAMFQIIAGHQRSITKRACGLEICVHVRQHGLDHLEFRNGCAELLSGRRMVERQIYAALRTPERRKGQKRSFYVQTAHNHTDTAVFCTNQILRRNTAVLENQLTGGTSSPTHLCQFLSYREAGKVLFDDKRRDAMCAATRIGLCVDEGNICDGAIGDENLVAVEHVAVTVAPRSGSHAAEGIGPCFRLSQCQRAH